MAESNTNGRNHKRTALIVIGALLGLFFLYLSFRDISWHDFVDGVSQIKPIYLVPATLLVLIVQLVRALRFGVIVRPFCPLPTRTMWDLLNIWAAANMVLPARLAEFVRPYLLQRHGASFSASFGAVIVERFFDLTGLLALLGFVLWKTPEMDPTYSFVGAVMLVLLLVGYAMVLLVLAKRHFVETIVERCLSVLPVRMGRFLGGIIKKIIDGLGIMASLKQASLILAYSVTLWVLFSTVTYVFLLAFSIEAPFLVAVTVQVVLSLAVALPSTPGFVGTFHYACRYALTLFGVQAVAAISFATVYHLFSLLVCLILGIVSYLTSEFRFDHSILPDRQEPAAASDSMGNAS